MELATRGFTHTEKTRVGVIISTRARGSPVRLRYNYTRVYVLCVILPARLLFLSRLVCVRLLICSDVLLRKLGTRTLSTPAPAPSSSSSSSTPSAARTFVAPRFLAVTSWLYRQWYGEISRNFTFESCASAALCGSSAASSEDNLRRIRPNSARYQLL